MAIAYRYQALDRSGAREAGVIEVDDRRSAIAELSGRGLFPIDVVADETQKSKARRMRDLDLAVGLRMLSSLVGTGLPVNKALAAFAEVAPPAWERGLEELTSRVRQGGSFSSALADSELGIPELIIAVLRAGEAGSGLDSAMARAAGIAESRAQLRSALRGALAYPALLATVGSASILVILFVVLPRFAGLISDAGGSVPVLARGLLAASVFARNAAFPLGLVGAGLATFIYMAAGQRARRAQLEALVLRLPLAGRILASLATSRVCASLGGLIEAGVPIAAALQQSAATAGNTAIELRILAARDDVIAGSRLSNALRERDALSALSVRLIRAGEDSSRVPEMLARASEIEATEVTENLRAMVRMLEPVMILLFATIIAVVAGALLQTVYSLKPA